MSDSDIILLVIISAVGLIFVCLAIIFLFEKGAFIIAGYNTLPQNKKDQFDEKKLLRFIGIITLIIGLLTPLVAIGGIYKLSWLIWLYVIVVVGLSIFAIVYSNTKDKFKKR